MENPRLFLLGTPASRALGWLAIGSIVAPVPFVLAWPRHGFIVMAIAGAIAIALAAVHRVRTKPRGWIAVRPWGIERGIGSRIESIARFAEPFGITVLASQARRRAILAVTTPSQTRFIGVRLDGPAAAVLVAHASVVADGDALTAHASEVDSLSAESAGALLAAIRHAAPNAVERLFLSGTRGERIVLDGTELRVDAMRFDLRTPLEWRGFSFHEALGAAASLYQATWIRQGSVERVLVAPMPTELLLSAGTATTAARRVLQPSADEPPPPDLRIGIERVFMLPVREALARAPRVPRAPKKRVSSPDIGA